MNSLLPDSDESFSVSFSDSCPVHSFSPNPVDSTVCLNFDKSAVQAPPTAPPSLPRPCCTSSNFHLLIAAVHIVGQGANSHPRFAPPVFCCPLCQPRPNLPQTWLYLSQTRPKVSQIRATVVKPDQICSKPGLTCLKPGQVCLKLQTRQIRF